MRPSDAAEVVRDVWQTDAVVVGAPKLGPRRSTYHLRGGWWLAVADGAEAAVLRREARLLSELDGTVDAIATPVIVPTSGGRTWHEDEHGRVWRVCTAVPGTNATDAGQLSWPSLSADIARFSAGLANISPAMAVRDRGVVAVAQQLLAELDRGDPTAFPAGRASIQRAAGFVGPQLERLLALPMQLTHGDCHLPNLFVGDDGHLRAVIDVEFAAPDPAIADLAALLASLVIDSGLDDLARLADDLFATWTSSRGVGSFDDLIASFVCGRLALYAHHRDRLAARAPTTDLARVLTVCAEYVDIAVRFGERLPN